MNTHTQHRFQTRPFVASLILWASTATAALAGGDFRSEDDAYEACRERIKHEWTQPGLHSFERHYARNPREAREDYVFWINSRVHDLDTGEVQQLRSRCQSGGFGLVADLQTEPGRWSF
ncbi:MAG: hypothetical protein GYB33_11120 [Gammaproteobacteria bacterium]|nr:hypothetical protein [Gammaproteobacteria bacterium]